MSASNIQITAGSGTRLATWSYSEGGQTVHDEKFIPGEFPYASYTVSIDNVSIATANDHIVSLMAGASLKVRVRRISIVQAANATTVSLRNYEVQRLGGGVTHATGTSITPQKMDTADSSAGATARALPGTKGTETGLLYTFRQVIRQATLATASQADDTGLGKTYWEQHPGMEPIVIPAGTTNGIAIKNITATAAGTVTVNIEFIETTV